MQPKYTIASLLFLFTAFTGMAQNHDPFASIGKKGKVTTLSNGKYEESFDDDSLQRIGSALVNINTMKVVKVQLSKEEQRELDNAANSRFLSVDPLTKKYAELTPYQFASNTPIQAVDLDGLENFHYTLLHNKEGNAYLRFDGIQYRDPGFLQGFLMGFGKKYKDEELNGDLIQGKMVTISDEQGYATKWKRITFEGFEELKKQNFEETPEQKELDELGKTVGVLILAKAFDASSTAFTTTPEIIESPTQTANKQTLAANGDNPAAVVNNTATSTSTNSASNSTNLKGSANPSTRAAMNLGNKVHYDQLNGGPAGSIGLPSELQAKYPNTQFRFAPRGASGPDVEVVGGTHPSQYPNSPWAPGNNYGDFKPGTASGNGTFQRDVRNGKLPTNTQQLRYNPTTGVLQ